MITYQQSMIYKQIQFAMNVFFPQFAYSRSKYQMLLGNRPTKHQARYQKNKQSAQKRLLTPTSFPINQYESKNQNSLTKSQISNSSKIFSIEEPDQKNKLKSEQKQSKTQRFQILKQLNSMHSNKKVYCMNFDDIRINQKPQMQQLNSYKKNQQKLIHCRKNTNQISRNLVKYNKSEEKRIRSFDPKLLNQANNEEYLITRKISELSVKNKRKTSWSIAVSKSGKDSKQLNQSTMGRYMIKTVKSSPRKLANQCRPWSPNKGEIDHDFIFG